MMHPKRVLLVFQQRPPIMDYLEKSFNDLGIEVIKFYSNDNTWFDRYIINRLNKQLHNLRILPKTKNLFQNHPLAHRNYLSAKLRKAYEETQPDLVLAIRGMDIGQDVLAHISCPKLGWWVEPETHIHEAVAEAAVVGAADAMTGQGIVAFVILRGGVEHANGEELIKELKGHVAKEIGAIARPRQIVVVAELPNPRCGKIMRRLLKDVAENRAVGDSTTLADPNVMKLISEGLKSTKDED